MKIVLTIVLILGVLLGPGYFIYCHYFSGSSVKELTVFQQADKDSVVSNNRWNTSVLLNLNQKMNPISIVASISYNKQPSRSTGKNYLKYSVKLEHDNIEQWDESINLIPKNRKKQNNSTTLGSSAFTTSNVAIKTFSVKESGEYSLNIKKLDYSKTNVENIDISIRKNVLLPNMAIVISSIITCLLSIIGFIFIKRL